MRVETPDLEMARIAQFCLRFDCTPQQALTQYASNLDTLRSMHAMARATGRKNGGFTAAQLADQITLTGGAYAACQRLIASIPVIVTLLWEASEQRRATFQWLRETFTTETKA